MRVLLASEIQSKEGFLGSKEIVNRLLLILYNVLDFFAKIYLMKCKKGKNTVKLEDEINKRLQDVIDRKKSESEALKKILKAFLKNDDGENQNIENIKKTEK